VAHGAERVVQLPGARAAAVHAGQAIVAIQIRVGAVAEKLGERRGE
jgi:hypothetical protein